MFLFSFGMLLCEAVCNLELLHNPIVLRKYQYYDTLNVWSIYMTRFTGWCYMVLCYVLRNLYIEGLVI